ncbi:hypothetical protein J6590_009965 [Homalodisca vitripennis]|nr:hypothetical protein J6590_009965 [Homalodisca vitripennis]
MRKVNMYCVPLITVDYILSVPELQNKLGPGWDRKEDVNGNADVVVSLCQSDEKQSYEIPGYNMIMQSRESNQAGVLPRTLVTWYQHLSKYIHTARPISKFYRGRWSLGTKIRRRTSTLCSSHLQVLPRALVTWYLNSSKDIHTVLVPFASSTEGAGHLVPKFVEGHPHCARPICKFYRGRWSLVLPRALVTWYINSSKDIHTVLVPFASSTEGAGHLVHKFVEGHPHCARPICKFYRGRWSLGTKICRSTSTLLVPFASSTEGAGHLVPKFVEVHPHSSSHLQVLLRALVTWYQNLSKYIHTVLVPFASSTEDAGHLVPKFVEVHPHSSSHLQVLLRPLVTWYQNLSKYIHTPRPICKFY